MIHPLESYEFLAAIELPISPELCWLVSMAILHALWQGVLVAALVAFLIRMNLPRSVHQRFVVCFLLLMLLGVSPIANALWLKSSALVPEPISLASLEFEMSGRLPLYSVKELAERDSAENVPAQRGIAGAVGSSTALPLPSESSEAMDSSPSVIAAKPKFGWAHWSVILSVLITLGYSIGALIMTLRLCAGARRQSQISRSARSVWEKSNLPNDVLLAAKQAAKKLGRKLSVPIATFQGRGSALVAGIFRPIVLVNVSLSTGLTPQQLEQILAHELVHIYRFDPLTQFCQRLIESLLFFHPGVWFISRQVSDLREMCCDRSVAEVYSNVDYALALLECAQMESGANSATERRLGLAATGCRTSQLSARIQILMAYENQQTSPTKSISTSEAWRKRWPVAIVACCLAAVVVFAFAKFVRAPQLDSMAVSSDLVVHHSAMKFDDSEWQWVAPEVQDIDSDNFMFGGETLILSSDQPADVEVSAMVDVEKCQFAQWHFGDSASTRVLIMAALDNGRLSQLFVDTNRDREISSSEEVLTLAGNRKTWLVALEAEVKTDAGAIRSKRMIGITPKSKPGHLRVNTIGYGKGQVTIGEKNIGVRRVDLDGNGIPTGNEDQIWFDLNEDGKFDLFSERFKVNSSLHLDGERWTLFSDQFGQSMNLTLADNEGSIEFVLNLNEQNASLRRLEGCLSNESGMLISLRHAGEPISVPTGRYRIESLLIEIGAQDGSVWRATLARGIERVGFDVVKSETQKISLLESLKFRFSVFEGADSYSGHKTELRPLLVTPNGLVVSNLVRVSKSAGDEPHERSTIANFDIDGTVDRNNQPMQSQSCYG